MPWKVSHKEQQRSFVILLTNEVLETYLEALLQTSKEECEIDIK